MKSLVRKWLMGETVFSEYVKITAGDHPVQKVWLHIDSQVTDVSTTHWLLCIEPIMYGVWIEKKEFIEHKQTGDFTLYLGGSIVESKNKVESAEAVLSLDLFDRINESDGTLLLLKLNKSSLHQLGIIKRYLLFFRYYKRDGLTFSRFKAFVSAYSHPRRIRVVSFRKDDYYNIFPMDLLGDISQHKRYVFGLRHSNVALPMILETARMVVSEVSYKWKDNIYELGKHHSSDPPSLGLLPFRVFESTNFRFYLPEWVESYKEVNIKKSLNLGSHMLLWGEIVNEERLTKTSGHLFLVHFLHYLHQKNKKGHPYQSVQ